MIVDTHLKNYAFLPVVTSLQVQFFTKSWNISICMENLPLTYNGIDLAVYNTQVYK